MVPAFFLTQASEKQKERLNTIWQQHQHQQQHILSRTLNNRRPPTSNHTKRKQSTMQEKQAMIASTPSDQGDRKPEG